MGSLHPLARAVLDALTSDEVNAEGPPDLDQLRRLEALEARFSGPPQEVASVRDVHIDRPDRPLRMRLYRSYAAMKADALCKML